MGGLIKMILDTSRLELGTLIVAPQRIDVVALAKTEVLAVATIAQEKGLRVRESYDPMELHVNMDPVVVQLLLQNLLSNAIKYTPAGGEISLSVVGDESKILVRVSDTGYGIPKSEQELIFKKLYRASNASLMGQTGSGLGLYMVRSIVKEAGGDMWFESEEGVGTTFFVSFPITGMKEINGNTRL